MSSLYLEYKIRKLLEKQAQTLSQQQLLPPPITQPVTGYRKQEVAFQRPFVKTPDVQMAASRDLGLEEEIMTSLPTAPLAVRAPTVFQEEETQTIAVDNKGQPEQKAQAQDNAKQNVAQQAPQGQAAHQENTEKQQPEEQQKQ